MHCVLPIVLTLACAGWLVVGALVFHNIRHAPRLERLNAPPPEKWPRISVVVPACNEGDTIDAAMRVRVSETYPNIEFIVVDDRSTDDTGAILDRFAAADDRVRVIHIDELPQGWLGKVHALHRGVQASTGEWLLLTDADVHIQPGTLEKVVAHCEQRGIDHLALLPQMVARGFGIGIANVFFLRIAISAGLVDKVEDPKSKVAAGGGVFNLCRRAALDRSPGIPRLRLEVVDDVALGFLLKAYGARCSVINGASGVSVCWYPSLTAMKSGLEKNGFAIFNYSLPLALMACLLMVGFEWAPFIAMLQIGHPFVQTFGAVAAAIGIATTVAAAKSARIPAVPALFYPLGALFFACALLRSAVLATWRGAIVWRGVRYPIKDLRTFKKTQGKSN